MKGVIKTVILVRFFYRFEKFLLFILTGVIFGLFTQRLFWPNLILVVKSRFFHGSRCFTCLPTVFGLIKFIDNWHLRFINFETSSKMSDVVKIGPYAFNKGLRFDNFSDLIEDFFVMFFLIFIRQNIRVVRNRS